MKRKGVLVLSGVQFSYCARAVFVESTCRNRNVLFALKACSCGRECSFRTVRVQFSQSQRAEIAVHFLQICCGVSVLRWGKFGECKNRTDAEIAGSGARRCIFGTLGASSVRFVHARRAVFADFRFAHAVFAERSGGEKEGKGKGTVYIQA